MKRLTALLVVALFSAATLQADEPRGAIARRLLERFDEDGDGKLSSGERQTLRESAASRRRGTNTTDEQQSDPSSLYKAGVGPFETKYSDFELHDSKQQKDLQVRVSYPVTGGDEQFPVIVFSHGAGGSRQAYQPLINHWVSHGYVCIQPTHGDSVSLLAAEERPKLRSLRDYIGKGLAEHQLTRPEDIRLVLDSLDEIESQIPGKVPRMDRYRIGMGGHSFGAHTSMMIAGMSLKMSRTQPRTTARDDRPTAFLMISPQGTGGQIDEHSWDNIDRPTMVVTGSKDQGRNGQSHEWRLEVFEHLKHNGSYLTFIDGATHDFGGISAGQAHGVGLSLGRSKPDHVTYVKSSSLAYWDSYLRDDETAAAFLNSDRLSQATKGVASVKKQQR